MTAELIIQVLLYAKTTSGIDYASSITEELIYIIYFVQRPSIIDLKQGKKTVRVLFVCCFVTLKYSDNKLFLKILNTCARITSARIKAIHFYIIYIYQSNKD